ncbi:MAG TPA: N-acetylmuramoyl-L-alanine amidase [Bacteroidia bacterium]|jgi:N-acetylmuramoyl-L-alanine amidase
MRSIFLFLFIISFHGFAQDPGTPQLINYYTGKAQKYLDKEKALSSFYSIDDKGIMIFANAIDKTKKKPEFSLAWEQLEDFRLYYKYYDEIFSYYKKGRVDPFPVKAADTVKPPPEKPLQGYRIAIDPGHIAHDHATGSLEMKHLKFRKDVVNGLVDSIEISEGILTFATARLLKDKLEAEGAEVMITRPEGYSAFGKTFEQWKKQDLKKAVDSLAKIGELKPDQKNYFLSAKAKNSDIFRVVFRELDLAKRAELINRYKPDLTIIIHYNVDETNSGWTKPGKKDFNMAFVGGAFMKNDLTSPEKRFEFLRLLITEDLERSVELSSSVINSFESALGIPTCGNHDATYITEGCLPTEARGVFCRNLQLTRYIHSPLVYGESIYQDNIKEAQLLNKETDKTKNERVMQVADAYFNGIMNYAAKRK